MDDLKKYLELDEIKINKSLENEDKLKKINDIIKKEGKIPSDMNETNYWKAKFRYCIERNPLENFLLYKTAGAFNIYKTGMDDADITEQALKALKKKLDSIENVEKVVVGKDIDFKEKSRTFRVFLKHGKDIYLESDIAYSLSGDLTAFLRIILKRKYGRSWSNIYIDKFKLDSNRRSNCYYSPFRNYFFYTLISDLMKELEGDEKECLNELIERAKLTHTLKNMILVPYGYNSPRGIYLSTYQTHERIQDRMDLTIKDFEEMQKDNDKNVEIKRRKMIRSEAHRQNFTAYSVKFLLEHKEELLPKKIPQYTREAMKGDICGILERTRLINEALR